MRPDNQSQPSQHTWIGRAPQLQRLTEALLAATGGSGQTVLISGAAGIGKTRLAQELVTVANGLGVLALTSRAYPLQEHLGYAPVRAALELYFRRVESAQRTGLLADLPHLRRLLDEVGQDPADKLHLFDDVATLIGRIADQQPLVWFIDDVHWADLATVELLYHLSRGMRNQSVLLVAAYRRSNPDGLSHPGLPLHAMVRAGLAEEVALDRLPPEQVALLVSERLGARPSRTLLDHLEARAAGNPLLLDSLLGSLTEQGLLSRAGGAVTLTPAAAQRPAPAGRLIILERLARFGHEERQVLDLLAVLGGAARPAELKRALGGEQSAVMTALVRLQEADLVSPDESLEWISLTHPLVQEVLYDELSPAVRRRYHAQAAVALERLSPVPEGRLARQYQGSGGEPNLLWLGQSLAKSGEFAASRDCLLEAAQALERGGDAPGAGRMLAHVAWDDLALGDLDAATAHIDMGIAKLGDSGWSAELVTLYGLRCAIQVLLGNVPGIARDTAHLGEAVGALDTPATRAWHSHALAWERLLAGQVQASLAAAEVCLDQAWLSQDPNVLILAAAVRGFTLLLHGDHQPAAAVMHSTLARLPSAFLLPAQHMLGPRLTMAETLAGNWELALQVSDESAPLEPLLRALPRASVGARAVVLIRRGDLQQARACLDDTSENPLPLVTDFEYAEALLALESGDYRRAVEAAAPLQSWGLAPLGFAVQAEALAELGEAEGVQQIAAVLTAIGSLGLPLVSALATWATALAERTAGDHDAAMGTFARATDEFGALAMPFEAARSRFEHARLMAAKDRRGAAALARHSLQTLTDLGAARWAARVRGWLAGQRGRSRATDFEPEQPAVPQAGRAAEALFSARELEIIRLLDEGRTNAEIAAHLVLSPRTVGNHLDRLYTRYGVKNRLGLVRFARESGVL